MVCCPRTHVATLLVFGIGVGGFYARDCLAGVSVELLDDFGLSRTEVRARVCVGVLYV